MATQKTGAQTFTSSWDKTVAWAKEQKIPYSAYYPVYQLDSQRFLAGSQMSEAERIRAIQASAGMNFSTALPTDNPDPANVVGNVKQNAAQIFTGLEPTNLFSNVFDTVKSTIQHPLTLVRAGEDLGKAFNPLANGQQTRNAIKSFGDQVLAKNSILSWVPGFADVATLAGHGGASKLAENPLTSLLDVLPLADEIPKALADHPTLGDAISKKLGVTKDDLRGMSSTTLAYRLTKAADLPGKTGLSHPAIITDAAGNGVDIRPMKIGERINAYRNVLNIGKDQADLNMGAIIKSEEGTRRVEAIAAPAVEALGKLKPEEYDIAQKTLLTDFRPESDVLADDKIPDNVRQALSHVYDYAHLTHQIKLASGDLVKIKTQFGEETYSVSPGSSGLAVLKTRDKAQAAQDTLDKAAKPFDALVYKIQLSDRKMQGAFAISEQNTAAIYGSIKRSIPELDNESQLSSMRDTLPQDQRWDRAVSEQTPLLRNLLGLPSEVGADARRLFPELPTTKNLTKHHVNAIRDLYSPGGLKDQAVKAYKNQDWIALSKYTRAAMRKFDNKAFENIPQTGNAFLFKDKQLMSQLHDYAVKREKDANKLNKIFNGTRHGELMAGGKLVKGSLVDLSRKAATAHQSFLAAAIEHPPDVWKNVLMDQYVDQIMNDERSAGIVDDAAKALKQMGYGESEVDKMRSDPRTIVELVARASKDTLENGMMPDIDYALSQEMMKGAKDEVASLRARGVAPAYVPVITPHDIREGIDPSYNINIGSLKPRRVGSNISKAMEFTSTIHDVQMGILMDAKDMVLRDIVQEYKDEYVSKYIVPASDANQLVAHYIGGEIGVNAAKAATGLRTESVDASIQAQLNRMGYISYDPDAIFGSTLGKAQLDKPYYIHKDMQSALESASKSFQQGGFMGFTDKATRVFRFSILGLSPRYTAHILFGGTWLLAARGHLSMLSQMRAGVHVLHNGQLPDDLAAQYPHFKDSQTNSATQEGNADQMWHRASGYSVGNKMMDEYLARHNIQRTGLNWVKAASQINFKFTRAVVRAQRAIVYLDAHSRTEAQGSFSEMVMKPVSDSHGNPVMNPKTGKQMYTEVEQRVSMSKERAHDEGMKAVADVMGELRHMTPLERNVFTKVFPFYGWTKHVLSYVLSYPVDHPYRATFLSQLATQNSEDVASGLPTRIQLLMFLGSPDAQGNVSAVDARFMDPLRDTANYASWQGLFQSLNPVLSAPLAEVDPQIIFGSNELYPTVSYNSLYGIKEAGPQGNLYNAAEQFVPQLSAVDAAFNLSGQYGYLKSQGGDAFAKKVYQSLNVPFFQVQHINLRQIAAQNELDRYSIASTAAYDFASNSNPNALAGYAPDAELPDPLNSQYNVTPAYLKALQDQSESESGVPLLESATPPPSTGL